MLAIPTLLFGGTERQLLTLVKALGGGGYDVTVFCYFEYLDEMVGMFKDEGADVVLMSPDGHRPPSFPALARSLFSGIAQVLKVLKPDVVHIQYNAPGSLAVLFFRLLGAKKIIVTAHTPASTAAGRSKRRWLVPKIVSSMCSAFICVSKTIESSFFERAPELFSAALFSKGRKHFTIYNCTELPGMIVARQARAAEGIVIGMAARIVHQKGVDIMLRAMPDVLKAVPDARLLIVGDGDKKDEYRRLADALEIADAVEWAGLQSQKAMDGFYARMDILAMPSRFEGFGLTAIEAMGRGVPVVASDIDGLGEVIENGASGLLVPREDAAALSDAVIVIATNPKMRTRLATGGRQRVEHLFSCTIFKQKIIGLYSQVLPG